MKTKFLNTADLKHHREFKRFVLEHADEVYRPALIRLYSLWEQNSEEFFGGKMTPPYILFASPSLPKFYGDYSPVSGFGGHSQIRIRPSLLDGSHPVVMPGKQYAEGRALFVDDILLHEMVHQWQQEIIGNPESSYSGHGVIFRDKCREIGEKLGLQPVRTCKARGKDKDLPSCSQWPHCVRPKGYYKGAVRVIREDVGAKKRAVSDLIKAAKDFARYWPDDAAGDPLALFTKLGANKRRRLLALCKAARNTRVQ